MKQSFMGRPSVFVGRKIIVFRQDGYSHYDNCFVYEFHTQGDGKTKGWFRQESQPEASWQQLFDPTDEQGPGK
jgi:hypothetical protein